MIYEITEKEFNSIAPIHRVIVHDHPRRFARLQLKNATYSQGISWRSDLVGPTMAKDPKSSVVWIGIDQRLVSLDEDGMVLFSIGLSTPLLQIVIGENFTIAFYETGFLTVNQDFSIRQIEELPDVLNSFELSDDKVIVSFIDGGIHSYPL